MILTLEIPDTSLKNIPFGYKKRLEERTLLQIYEDGYISQRELKYAGKILTKYFRNLVLAQLKRKSPLNSCSKDKSIFMK